MAAHDQLRGLAALEALESAGRSFAFPAEAADVIETERKTIYAALERGDIPGIRVGQRWRISVAWLRRQVDGVPEPQRTAAGAA